MKLDEEKSLKNGFPQEIKVSLPFKEAKAIDKTLFLAKLKVQIQHILCLLVDDTLSHFSTFRVWSFTSVCVCVCV